MSEDEKEPIDPTPPQTSEGDGDADASHAPAESEDEGLSEEPAGDSDEPDADGDNADAVSGKPKTLTDCLKRLRKVVNETEDAIFAGRKALWRRLGHIYADSKLVTDELWEMDLQNAVEGDKPKGTRWDARDKTIRENLLVFAMGFDCPASKRSLYKRVFEIADEAEASANLNNPEKFAQWVESNRGLVALCEKTSRSGTKSDPHAIIEAFAAKRRQDSEKAMADAQGDIDEATLTLLLVERRGDELRVVKSSAEDGAVAAFIRATDDELSEMQKAKQRRDHLYRINRAVLRSAGKGSGDTVVWRDAVDEAEASAVERSLLALWNDDELRDTYFDAEPSIKFDGKALAVVRPNEHQFDPARYVMGAKPGALVPYGVLTSDVKDKASLEALPDFKRWKAKPPRTSKATA